jgi:hypothetical protein
MPLKSAALLAAAVLLVPGAALAAHGRVGLWESTTSVTMAGMPPQAHKATYCMTAAEVASDAAPGGNPNCTYQNAHVQGHTYSADMVCTGTFQAKGHFTSTYDSDTHFTAVISMTGDGFAMTNNVEGKWLKADCAGATQP